MKTTLALVSGLGLLGLACPGAPAQATKADDAAQIKATLEGGCAAFVNGDAAAAMDFYSRSDKLVVFDISPPRSKTYDQVKKTNDDMLAAVDGKPTCEYVSLVPVILDSKFAYSMGVIHTTGKLKSGASFDFNERTTDIWQKIGGKWLIIHEHNSVPVDVMTGKGDLASTP
jgi:ketosteroid isomerase-like protein